MRATSRAESRQRLVAHAASSPQRQKLEDFVRHEFLAHFDARPKHFMPLLLALHGEAGDLHGVVGCRRAADEPLFLETYTRAPIEQVIGRNRGVAIAREEIVEIGGLACRGARAAVELGAVCADEVERRPRPSRAARPRASARASSTARFVYTLGEKGLMASADVSGTRFWVDES